MRKLLLVSLLTSSIIGSDEPAAAAAASTSQDAKSKLALLKSLMGHTNGIAQVKFSAYYPHLLASGSADKTVKLWNVDFGICTDTLAGHIESVTVLAYSSDNHLLSATGIPDADQPEKRAMIWDLATGACLQTISQDGNIVSAAYSPDAHTIVLGIQKYTPHYLPTQKLLSQAAIPFFSIHSYCRLWDVRSSKVVCDQETGAAMSLQYAADGSFIAAGGGFGFVILTNDAFQEMKHVPFRSNHSRLTPDQQSLVCATYTTKIKQLDIGTAQQVKAFVTTDKKTQYCVDVTPDNVHVVSGTQDGYVCLFDAASGNYLVCVRNFDNACPKPGCESYKDVVECVSCSADNSYVAASSGFCNDIKIDSLQ